MTGSVGRLDTAGIMKRLGDSGCLQPDDADPQGAEFARPLTAEAFHGVEGDAGAAYLGDGLTRRRGSYRPDDARSARGHLPPRRPDCTARPIEHRVLVLEKHFIPPG